MELYEHQKEVLKKTRGKNKVAYYLDMGLGKTFVGSEKMKELNAKINLVVCQKSKVDDWIEHFELFYDDFLIYDGTKKECLKRFFNYPYNEKQILVINYDLIFRRPELSKLKGFTLMLDESSLIQNESSKRTKFILNKLKPENIILLSGSPTGGKYEKLYSQVKLLGWNIKKSLYWSTYVNYHYHKDFPIKIVDGYKNVDRLKRKLNEYNCIFMKSEEVLNLPEQIYSNIKIPTCKEYKEFLKNKIVMFKDKKFVGDTPLTTMLYLRMLCNNDNKLKALQDLIESTDDRLIIFYNFNDELKEIIKIISKIDKKISIVNGEFKDLKAYNEFNNSITLIQYTSGSMGLNLQLSNKIIYYSPPLSYELYAQSIKRTHRIGQKKSCFYYKLICKNSIEEKIYKTLKKRKNYTERLFEHDF